MAMFFNYINFQLPENLFDKLCEKNPSIKEKYEAMINKIIEEYTKCLNGQPHSKCIIMDKGVYTFENGETYYGYALAASFGTKNSKSNLFNNYWDHRFMLIMEGDEPIDLIEIDHHPIRKTAKVYQFPNIKRGPREFFLKEPNPKDPK
jgi:hypothetical protein